MNLIISHVVPKGNLFPVSLRQSAFRSLPRKLFALCHLRFLSTVKGALRDLDFGDGVWDGFVGGGVAGGWGEGGLGGEGAEVREAVEGVEFPLAGGGGGFGAFPGA